MKKDVCSSGRKTASFSFQAVDPVIGDCFDQYGASGLDDSYPEEEFSPDDFEDYGWQAPNYPDFWKSISPFLFVEQDTKNAHIGFLCKAGKPIALVKINSDDDYDQELGGKKFLDTLVDVLNGQDTDVLLRQHRPSDFGFFFIEEMDGYKVGRREQGITPCKVWGFHILAWNDKPEVLKKAVARALIRVGLNEREGKIMPCPTRTRKIPVRREGFVLH